MQTVSTEFTRLSQADIRPLNWRVAISFDKVFDDNTDFFTIGTSIIGGHDFMPGTGSTVQEWDKYIYTDYSDRLISLEWTHQEEPLASVTLAMADIILDNHDDYFTPGSGSDISNYILPYRPIRIYAGFGDELIPVFIGLTEQMPAIDETSKTASFHCIDFLQSLLSRPLDESALYLNKRLDEVLQSIFVLAGLLTAQLDLDESATIIPYASFSKGTLLKDAVYKLLQIDQGRVYLSPEGFIKYRNRQSYSSTPVYSFNAYDSIVSTQTRTQDDIINVVIVEGIKYEPQPLQVYWESPFPTSIDAGDTVTIWASFASPVSSVVSPVYIDSAISSYFEINTVSDGTGTANSTDVTLTSTQLYGNSYQMVFTSTAATSLYITKIKIFAEPVVPISNIYVREEDAASVSKYDERPLHIQNDFIQDQTDAQSFALVTLDDYAEYGGVSTLQVKGTPALEIGDPITVNVFDRIDDYKITKIVNKISLPGRYTQLLTVKNFTRRTYFTIGVSTIAGTDALRP